VFFSLAFAGVIPTRDLFLLMLTQTAMKTGYEIVVLPLTNFVVNWMKKKEETDVFDYDISYSPIKLNEI